MGLDDIRERVRAAAEEHGVVRDILMTLHSGDDSTRVTTVDDVVDQSDALLMPYVRHDIVRGFQVLAAAGAGRFIVGRRGKKSRIAWHVEPTTLRDGPGPSAVESAAEGDGESDGTADLGGVEELPLAEPEAARQDFEPDVYDHRRPIRPGVEVLLRVPVDLSVFEAHQLARWILTLPMEATHAPSA